MGESHADPTFDAVLAEQERMLGSITLKLPYPPSVNKYWRTFQGRMILSVEGRQYRAAAFCAIVAQRAAPFGSRRVAVEITTHQPDRRRRDLDNVAKASLDALTHAGIYDDDSQIDDLRITRGAPAQPGVILVRITPLEPRP